MKTITIISLGSSTCHIFCEQLRHLLGHNVTLCPYAKEDGWPERITGDVVLLTTSQLLPEVQPLIDDMSKVVVTRRSINYHELYKLFQIPLALMCCWLTTWHLQPTKPSRYCECSI